jgi:hypothetical protein
MNEVTVYNKTAQVETPPLRMGEKIPSSANPNKAMIIVN